MNIQAQKAIIIEQFKQVNDVNLINAIKNLLDYALKKEQENMEIPEEHKNIVRERIKDSEKEPSRRLNWDEVKNKIKL
jgi:hypothetical protein